MRHIKKGCSPEFFENWKQNFRKVEGREPKYQDLRGEDYHNLKIHIIDEQYGLCCYCCKEIQDYNSHIEHLKPQHQYQSETLNYSNLLVSCNGYKDNKENCGHRKDRWYDEYYTITPIDENCESFFTYTIDGQIRSNREDTRAQETINKLELNIDLLQRARRTAIYVSGLFDEDFEQIKAELIDFYSIPQDGKLKSFCIAILYCLLNI